MNICVLDNTVVDTAWVNSCVLDTTEVDTSLLDRDVIDTTLVDTDRVDTAVGKKRHTKKDKHMDSQTDMLSQP